MRRWCAAAQLLGWRQLRLSTTHAIEAHIRDEVQKALCRLRRGISSPAWVPMSRVSSVLPEETREALAEVGGLAGFCRRPQGVGGAGFAVKTVDGVLCVKLDDVVRTPVKHKRRAKSNESEEDAQLQRICSILPYKPVALAACQRAWKLSTMDATLQQLTSLMKEVESVLKRGSGKRPRMSLYLQVGYEGRRVAVVAAGSQAMKPMLYEDITQEEGEGDNGGRREEGGRKEGKHQEPRWHADDFAPLYDMCRLSRLLQTDSFLSIDEIKQRAVGILQSPLLQVAMTYPERIVLQLGPTIDIEAAEEDRLYLGGASRCEVHEVLGVKFVLSDEEVAQHLRSRSGRLSDLTDEQLREERVKLKELQPLRRQKFRRAIVREEFRRRYPHGNPFLNPDVVALHIYDQMVPGVWVNSATLRETLLPDGGKGAMHVGVDFFDKYPHLFITQSVTTTSVNVMRREQDMEDVQSDGDNWNSMVFRDEDILLLLLPRLSNKRDDWGDNKWIEVLTALLPRHVFKYMQRRRGGAVGCLETILRRYPEAFEVMEVAQTNCIEKPRVKVRLHQDGIMRLGPKLLNELHGAGKGEDLVQEKEEQESSGVGVGIGAEGVSEVPHH